MHHQLRISLVIPVYNEEGYLAECLRTVLAQRQPFHEIIIVDNNSSNNTAAIAASFKTIKLLNEPRQGVVFARDTGFKAASGDIIARIDADTRLPADWSMQLQRIFSNDLIDAVTGSMEYYDIALATVFNRADRFLRNYYNLVLGKNTALQASNMAIRRTAWKVTQQKGLCHQAGLHEDFDLGIHAHKAGFTLKFDPRLHAAISCRQSASNFRTFALYFLLCPKTYRQHRIRRGYHMYPVIFALLLSYPAFRILYQGYDSSLQRFSFKKLFLNNAPTRVNPATFVD